MLLAKQERMLFLGVKMAYAEAAYTQIDWSRVEGFKKELLELQD